MALNNPWIHSSKFDLTFILAPQLLVVAGLVIFSEQVKYLSEIPAWLWLVLIVGVDVSHVYSTIFRTYLDPRELSRNPFLYKLMPVLAWGLGVLIYNISSLYFWRLLAYFAVFHFIRQQYGFMMIYSTRSRFANILLDKIAIYACTVYPIIFWHTNTRNFSWFINGDFFFLQSSFISLAGFILYLSIIGFYIFREISIYIKHKTFNLQKNLLLFGTALTWWVGIITFNNDLAFTATNVIAHGVPYIALIWIYKFKEAKLDSKTNSLFSIKLIPIFLGILFIIAYLEEAIWDGFVWHEHREIFFNIWDSISPSDASLSLIVPLLILPQLLHYIFDAYIWKLKDGDPHWKRVLFSEGK